MPASGAYQHENADEPDIMSWFPRREDYEDKPAFVPDESYEEKIQRLKKWMNKFSLHIKYQAWFFLERNFFWHCFHVLFDRPIPQ